MQWQNHLLFVLLCGRKIQAIKSNLSSRNNSVATRHNRGKKMEQIQREREKGRTGKKKRRKQSRARKIRWQNEMNWINKRLKNSRIGK